MVCFSIFIPFNYFSINCNMSDSKTSFPFPSGGLPGSMVPEMCYASVQESEAPRGPSSPCSCCSPALPERWCHRSSQAALPPPMLEADVQKHAVAKNVVALTQLMAPPEAVGGWKVMRVKGLALPADCIGQADSQLLAQLHGAGFGGCMVAALSCKQAHRDSEIASLPRRLDDFLSFPFLWC